MTKQEFDSKFAGENTVVNCKTEELARKFLDKATEFGYKWGSGSYYVYSAWQIFKKQTYYHIYSGKIGNMEWIEQGKTVVEFNGFEGE